MRQWAPTVSGVTRSTVVIEPEDFVDASSQPSAELVTDHPLTGAAFELNPGSGTWEPSPEDEQGLTGAASVLNPNRVQ